MVSGRHAYTGLATELTDDAYHTRGSDLQHYQALTEGACWAPLSCHGSLSTDAANSCSQLQLLTKLCTLNALCLMTILKCTCMRGSDS